MMDDENEDDILDAAEPEDDDLVEDAGEGDEDTI